MRSAWQTEGDHIRIAVRLGVAATSLAVLLTSCTSSVGDAASAVPTVQPSVSSPDVALTLIADADPAAAAVSTSRALFDSSEVVVLADPHDPASLTLGASAAVALGVPLLLRAPPTAAADSASAPSPDPGSTPAQESSDALGIEFERLGVTTVLAIGGDAAQPVPGDGADVRAVQIPPDAVSVGRALGIEFVATEAVRSDGFAAAFAALDPESPAALLPDGAPTSAPNEVAAPTELRLPRVERPEPVTDTFVLAAATPEALPGIATARAAGVEVAVVSPDRLDPRSSAEAITALSRAEPEAVIVLGAGYASQQGLDWKLATAIAGMQLPGGGQLMFQDRMLIGLYGGTEGGALGVLGEQDANGAVQRAIETAGRYAGLVASTVVPTFEIIATVASEFPGPDGNYSTESSIAQLQPWVDAASAAGIYVLLDLQPGRTDFLTQARAYEPLLRLPNVGLALDPEWRLKSNQVHLTQIGSVSIEEVNGVVAWLADLTQVNSLPQKLLVLHQFLPAMVRNRELLDTTREELAVLIHVDGYGSPADKQTTWQTIRDAPPPNVYWGWKNFIDEDRPLLTPEQTIAQALPTPDLITYQ